MLSMWQTKRTFWFERWAYCKQAIKAPLNGWIGTGSFGFYGAAALGGAEVFSNPT